MSCLDERPDAPEKVGRQSKVLDLLQKRVHPLLLLLLNHIVVMGMEMFQVHRYPLATERLVWIATGIEVVNSCTKTCAIVNITNTRAIS